MKKLTLLIAIFLLISSTSCTVRRIGDTDITSDAGADSAQTECADEINSADASQTEEISQTEEADSSFSADSAVTEKITSAIPDDTAPSEPDGTTSIEPDEADAPPVIPEKGSYAPAVFMYHLILDEPYSPYENLFVRPSEFEAQVKILNSLGYSYEFAENYGIKEYPTAILTFDDGYEDNYTEMFPIIKKYNARATVFVATSLIGTEHYLTQAQIREMSESGLVSFQSHTVNHSELTYLNEAYIRSEMEKSIEIIEGITGKKVKAFAYPAGRYNDLAVSVVGEYADFAYTTESPYKKAADNPLLIPRHRIPRGYPDSAMKGICEDYAK